MNTVEKIIFILVVVAHVVGAIIAIPGLILYSIGLNIMVKPYRVVTVWKDFYKDLKRIL